MRTIMPLFVLIACILCLAATATAQPPSSPAELAGAWTYAREASGHVYVDTLELADGPDGPTGSTTYMDKGEERHELFKLFSLDPGGDVVFVTNRPGGTVVRHEGEWTEDGRSIRGRYSLGMGVGGPFVLARRDAARPLPMSARWEYQILDPEGGAGMFAEGGLLQDTTGRFEGYFRYRRGDGTPRKVEGEEAADGTLTFLIYEKKTYRHQGTLDAAGTRAEGRWTDTADGKGGGFVLLRMDD